MSAGWWPWLLPSMAMMALPAVAADIHARVDGDGRLRISDRPMAGSRPFDRRITYPAPSHARRGAAQDNLVRLIDRIGTELGVDGALLHAIVQQESAYDPHARSRAGAIGLMQLMPDTAKRFGVVDRYDPTDNLRGGAAYVSWLLAQFGGNIELTLAAYNAGEGAVRRHGNRVPPYRETRDYVRRVMASYRAQR